jgi:nitrogen fixation NifU-like protein
MSDLDDFLNESQELLVKEVREHYSAQVVDHWLHPRNARVMDRPDGRGLSTGVCGDEMQIDLRIRGERVVEASFMTDGCLTSIVTGSMAVELATGRSVTEARAVSPQDILDGLGGLPEESEHCAELASETLRAAVDDYLRTRGEPWRKLYVPGR